jgi:xanthine dehydrogenase accessory factor
MLDVMSGLIASWHAGETVGLGTVVHTVHSAPRPAGASMLVGKDGNVTGSVSGGCIESAVYELCEEVINGAAPVLQRYGFSDDEAFAVGLTCGGIIDVFVEPISRDSFPELPGIAADIQNGDPVAVATVIEHPEASWLGRRMIVRPDGVEGTLGLKTADDAVSADARAKLATGTTSVSTYGPEGQRLGVGMRVFVSSFQPKPRMIVFGAIDFAAAVAQQGKFLGYHVTVCDARPIFTTKARFPDANDVVVAWPHRYLQEQASDCRLDSRTVLCVLTHDPKFDVPLLDIALRLEDGQRPAYIGVMGSRRTHDDRLERLRAAGLAAEHLSRMSSPMGLDIGGRTPEETAVSIAAEIIALRCGGSGKQLSRTTTDIHHGHGTAPAAGITDEVETLLTQEQESEAFLGRVPLLSRS